MKILALCWRDTTHPQGGGSERYLEQVCRYAAAAGHTVIYRSAHVAGQPDVSVDEHVIHHRFGGVYTVYVRAFLDMVAGRFGRGRYKDVDVVIDTQNGIPFFAALASGKPTVVLTHHCHRQQWPVAGPLIARIGWLIESRISPFLHRGNHYVTVSRASLDELVELGVDRERITIIRNGVDQPAVLDRGTSNNDTLHSATAKAVADNNRDVATPVNLVCVARLVPHKQIEHAIDTVVKLARDLPVHLHIVGDGWWRQQLIDYAEKRQASALVTFHGHVDEKEKHRILSSSDIHLMPSKKEGWGLAVTEAALHGVPTIGYRESGGLNDSVVDTVTGLLVDSQHELFQACRELCRDSKRRHELGAAAQAHAAELSWEETGQQFAQLLEKVVSRTTRD